MDETKRATIFGLLANIFLCIIKATAAFMTGSVAILSDTINSFLDILSSLATHFSVRLSKREADKKYPFGYKRAEPIAALLIAIVASIVAFEIFKTSIIQLVTGVKHEVFVSIIPVVIMFIAIFVKIIMSNYTRIVGEKNDSPALIASSMDFRNDILASIVALLALIGSSINLYYIDNIASIIVAGFIFYSGYSIGIKNLDYLMGKSPDNDTLFEIKRRTLRMSGVKNISDVKAHYVGNYIHVELTVIVHKHLTLAQGYAIQKDVKRVIEEISHIDKAFVNIEPK